MLLLSITFKFLTCILANNSIQHCKDQLYHPSHICGAIKSNLCGKEHKQGKFPISFKITARPYHHQMLSPFFRHPSRPQLSCQRNVRGHSTRLDDCLTWSCWLFWHLWRMTTFSYRGCKYGFPKKGNCWQIKSEEPRYVKNTGSFKESKYTLLTEGSLALTYY